MGTQCTTDNLIQIVEIERTCFVSCCRYWCLHCHKEIARIGNLCIVYRLLINYLGGHRHVHRDGAPQTRATRPRYRNS